MIYNPWELDPLGDMEIFYGERGRGRGKKKFPIKILAKGAGG